MLIGKPRFAVAGRTGGNCGLCGFHMRAVQPAATGRRKQYSITCLLYTSGLATRGVDMTTESMKDSPSDAEKYGGFGIMGYFTGQETFDNVKNTVAAGYMYNLSLIHI